MTTEEMETDSIASLEESNQNDESSSSKMPSLSKSWYNSASHVPTFTGGKVSHCHKHDPDSPADPFLLLPVHGDLAIVDAVRGVKLGTIRGEDALGEEDDEDDGVDFDAITSYALTHKDQTIITCTRNNILNQYSISDDDRSTKLVKTWGRSGHSLPVTNMEFHISDVFLATGSVDGTVRVFDVRGAFVTHVFRPLEGGDGGGSGRLSVTALKWRDEMGQLVLAIGRDDGSMTIHDLKDNSNIVVLRDHVSPVTCMHWWGEEFFISAGRDAILNLWRVVPTGEKGRENKSNKFLYRRIQSIPVYEQIEGMLSIPSELSNQIKIVTAGSKGLVRLWKATVVPGQTPELIQAMEQPASQAFGEARGGYTGMSLNHVAVTSNAKEDQIIVADAEHNLSFLSSKLSVDRTIVGHNDEILDIKIIPNSSSVVVATNSPQIRIFDLNNFSCKVLDGHTATVLCIDVSPCGRFLASSGKDKTTRIWKIDTLQCVAIATGHTEPIGACGLSQKSVRYDVGGKAAINGGGAFCVTASLDRTIKRWNFPGATEIEKSTDIHELVAASSVRGHEKDINIVSVAPNDSLIASGSQDKTVRLWNATDLSLKATLKGHRRGVWDCQFSPIDRVLATSSGDKTIKLWSLGDFSCVRTFQGHLSSVLRVRFLRTGLQLVSSGADGLIKLWTIRTNECETTLDGHTNKVWALDSSFEDQLLVSGGADSTLVVWKDNTQQIEDEERSKEAENIQLNQMLQNHLYHREYDKALELALKVDKPMTVMRIISGIIESGLESGSNCDGLELLQQHVKTWDMDRVEKILKYCRDWNTRARNASIAMTLVKAIVTTISVDKLSSVKGLPEILAGITPYAERHFDRLDRLYTSSFMLDFALSSMGVFSPSGDAQSREEELASWEASSKLVLPPSFIDGRTQVGGKAYVGGKPITAANEVSSDIVEDYDDDSIETIGDETSVESYE